MTRRNRLLDGIDLRQARGFEVGAQGSPIVRKHESEVYYVDHLDQAALREKYRDDPNVDIAQIVPVDAVWGEQTLRECLPAGMFDYAIASHVIEHVPDVLGWLREIADVLRPGARLALAIPDKRFTFDYLRATSRLSDVVDAYLRGNRRPMPAQLFDFCINAAEVDSEAAWAGPLDPDLLKRHGNLRFAWDQSVAAVRGEKYIDAHCWVFTPTSLLLLLADLAELELLPYRCAAFHAPEMGEHEMLLVLERIDPAAAPAGLRADFLARARALGQPADPPELAVLRDQLAAARAELRMLHTSHSWRLTEPLRALRRWLD